MFEKLAIWTLATGIILSGVTGASAAQINDEPLKASDNQCENLNHKFSELFNSSKPPQTYTKNGIKGKLVCTYKSPLGYIGYYN